MSFQQGINFRATAGYVTDPTNYTHDLGTTVYPTMSAQGNNIGWVSTSTLAPRDRNSAIDARLAGIVFTPQVDPSTFKIDLPAAGTYLISIAMGDDGGSESGQTCRVFDGVTLLATLVPINSFSAGGSFYDATGTQYTAAAWPGSNTAVSLSFTGTTASITIGNTSGAGGNCTLASIFITAAGGGTADGALAATFPDFTLAGTGMAMAAGALAIAFSDFTLAGAGTATAAGALAIAFSDFTLVGAGTVTSGPSGSLSATFGDFTLAGTGKAITAGALAAAFGNFTLVGTGTATAAGALAVAFGDFTLAGTGTVLNAAAGTLAITFGNFTLVATGFVPLPSAPAITYATVFTEADLILAMRLARQVYRLTGVMSPGYTNMVAVYRQLQSGSPISNTQPTTSEARKNRISYGLGGYRRRRGRGV